MNLRIRIIGAFQRSAATFIGVTWYALVPGEPNAMAQIPCEYRVQHVIQGPHCGEFGYPPTTGTAISPNGRYVVGYYDPCLSGLFRAFVFDTQTSQFITLPLPATGWYGMSAADVNDDAIIVGEGTDGNAGGLRGWVYDLNTAGYTIIEPLPGGAFSGATGVNASGVVCGWRSIGPGPNPQNAFTWTVNGGIVDLGLINGQKNGAVAINNDAEVIGWVGSVLSPLAFYSSNRRITVFGPVPGTTACVASDVNRFGDVAGGSAGHPFIWNGEFVLLPCMLAPFDQGIALAVTDPGLIVGACFDNEAKVLIPIVWIDALPNDVRDMTVSTRNLSLRVVADVASNNAILVGAFDDEGSNVAAVLSAQLPIDGDTGCDGHVNVVDLLDAISNWGPCMGCAEDLNGDQSVNINDILLIIYNWIS